MSTRKKNEVDIRVAQELKNHRDFVYETHQALNKLEFDISRAVSELARTKAEILSDVKRLYIDHEKFHEAQKKEGHQLRQVCSDSSKKAVFAEQKVIKYEGDLKALLNIVNEVMSNSEHAYKAYQMLDEAVKRIQDHQDHYLKLLRNEMDRRVEIAIGEIPKPRKDSDIPVILNEIATLKAENEGLRTEIHRLIKGDKYREKQVEALLNRIERLKAKVEA